MHTAHIISITSQVDRSSAELKPSTDTPPPPTHSVTRRHLPHRHHRRISNELVNIWRHIHIRMLPLPLDVGKKRSRRRKRRDKIKICLSARFAHNNACVAYLYLVKEFIESNDDSLDRHFFMCCLGWLPMSVPPFGLAFRLSFYAS